MSTHAEKPTVKSTQNSDVKRNESRNANDSDLHFPDNRPEVVVQRKLLEMANGSVQKQATNSVAGVISKAQSEQANQARSITAGSVSPVQLKPDWKASKLKERRQTTANKVWEAEIKKKQGFGRSKRARGIAKRQSLANDPTPDSAINVGAVTTNKGDALPVNPRMLARQVTSWKLAKEMGMSDLHARERYVQNDKIGRDGGLYGVSELFEGGKTIQDLAAETPEKLESLLKEPAIQKQLSDLQLFDFIAGQSDRHLGNIMIGPNNTVKAIDNDQAFPAKNKNQNLRNNQVNSFTLDNGALNFTQKLIDSGTANTVKGMTRQSLVNAFTKGSEGEESLTVEELNAAEERLIAVQARIADLEGRNKLIGQDGGMQWGPQSYQKALDTGLTPGTMGDDFGTNNIWRSMRKVAVLNQMMEEEQNQRKMNNRKGQRGRINFG